MEFAGVTSVGLHFALALVLNSRSSHVVCTVRTYITAIVLKVASTYVTPLNFEYSNYVLIHAKICIVECTANNIQLNYSGTSLN